MQDKIYLIENNAAVDAVMITKDEAISKLAKEYDLPLFKIATIGDEICDLPMLQISGLGKIGTVYNAQERVKDYVYSMPEGYLSFQEAFDGFMSFYHKCKEDNIKLIITDKDGVLKKDSNMSWGEEYLNMALKMGQDNNPFTVILTGSSVSQNEIFRRAYGLDERLIENKAVKENPYLILAESGAIHLNVLTGETKNYCSELNPDLLEVLKGPFEKEVADKIEDMAIKEFEFKITDDYKDQQGKVYHIKDKKAGVSFNIPRTNNSGKSFRETIKAMDLRHYMVEIMADVAERLKIDYKIM